MDSQGVTRKTIGLMLASTLLLSGCSFQKDAVQSETTDKTLRLATGFKIENLVPADNGFWGNEFGYSELLLKPDRSGKPTSWVLASAQATNPTTWTLKLTPKVTFQNGKQLTAKKLADVMTHQLGSVAQLGSLLPGAQVRVQDDATLTMITTKPTPDLPNILADEANFKVYDLEAFQAAEKDPAKLIDAKIYTGPYTPTALDSQSMTMKPNPHYWGKKPALDGVELKFVSDAGARIKAVQNKEVDLALYPPTQSAQTLVGDPVAKYVTNDADGPSFQLVLNHAKAPFSDAAIRQAVSAIIDYDALAKEVMQGMYEPAHSMYNPKLPFSVETWKKDHAKAADLLQKAGATQSADKQWLWQGKPITFTTLTYPQQPDSGALALAIQAQLKQFGITMNISQVPDISAAFKQDNWEAGITGNGTISFGGSPIPPLVNGLKSDGKRNQGKIKDSTLDALIDKVAVASDEKVRDQLLVDIQRRIADQGHTTYLGRRKPNVVVGPKMAKFRPPHALMWVSADTTLQP